MSAVAPRPERLGIVGSGTIACGLAACAARHGEVTLWARSDASAERAERSVAKVCSKFEDRLPPDRVQITTDLSEGLEDRTFVVEAIAEHMDAKVELFARLRERLDDGALLGTTTSSLPVCTLADASACARMRVSGSACGGNASSMSSIRATGLNTWKPTKRSGRPLASASSQTGSDEVVVPSTAPSSRRWRSRANSSTLVSMCSAIASTTNVRLSRPSDRSVVIRTRSAGSLSSNFEQTFATDRSARSAEASDRAQSVTSP